MKFCHFYLDRKCFTFHIDYGALTNYLLLLFSMKIYYQNEKESQDADAISQLCINFPSDRKENSCEKCQNTMLKRFDYGRSEVNKDLCKALLYSPQ